MKISDNAKEVLLQALEENGADGLRVAIQETCCGKSPVIGLDVYAQDEAPEEVNGIKIMIPEEAKPIMEDIEIDLVNGELVVLNTVCGCGGGCGGCGHDHE